MDTKTELLLDYQEMAILALREEVERLTKENEFLTLKLKATDRISKLTYKTLYPSLQGS